MISNLFDSGHLQYMHQFGTTGLIPEDEIKAWCKENLVGRYFIASGHQHAGIALYIESARHVSINNIHIDGSAQIDQTSLLAWFSDETDSDMFFLRFG